MKEARSIRLGKALGYRTLAYINRLPKNERDGYRQQLAKGIKRLKFKERKRGEPLKEEHRIPLEGLDLSRLDFTNPKTYQLVEDEIMQLTYSAQRAREIQKGLLYILETEK